MTIVFFKNRNIPNRFPQNELTRKPNLITQYDASRVEKMIMENKTSVTFLTHQIKISIYRKTKQVSINEKHPHTHWSTVGYNSNASAKHSLVHGSLPKSLPTFPELWRFSHTSMTHQVFASTPKHTTNLIATTWDLELVTSVLALDISILDRTVYVIFTSAYLSALLSLTSTDLEYGTIGVSMVDDSKPTLFLFLWAGHSF